MKNFILTDETLIFTASTSADTRTLHRIMAIKSFKDVLSGDTGGWVEKEGNLIDNGWVYDDAIAYGDSIVANNAELHDNARIGDDATISDNAKLFNNATLIGKAKMRGQAEAHDNVVIKNVAKVGSLAKLYQDIIIDENIMILGGSWSGITVIHGSKFPMWQPTPKTITVGCATKFISDWQNEYQQFGQENGFTQEEIDEYGIYIQQIADLYN